MASREFVLMLTIPANPYAFQDRVMSALIGDILDTGQPGFARLDAMRAVTASVGRNPEGGDAKQGSVEDEHAVPERQTPAPDPRATMEASNG